MNGSWKYVRWPAGVAVLAVSVIAAIVSYAHIESLALANGYTLATPGCCRSRSMAC